MDDAIPGPRQVHQAPALTSSTGDLASWFLHLQPNEQNALALPASCLDSELLQLPPGHNPALMSQLFHEDIVPNICGVMSNKHTGSSIG